MSVWDTAATSRLDNDGNFDMSGGSQDENLMGKQELESGFDSLMGGGKLPSLITKEHGQGVKRTGIIREEPRQKQSYDFAGNPKFWDDAARKVVNHDTGKPMYDTVFVLDTEYRFTAQDAPKDFDPSDDDGTRGLFAGGEDLKAIKRAIAKNRELRGKPRSALVGKRLTIWRTGQRDVGKGNPQWLYEAEITNA